MKARLLAEGIGSFFLFATVIGSGIMAEKLAGGNIAVALLGNTHEGDVLAAILDPILDPIHFGFADSLARYREIRARLPDIRILVFRPGVHDAATMPSSSISSESCSAPTRSPRRRPGAPDHLR